MERQAFSLMTQNVDEREEEDIKGTSLYIFYVFKQILFSSTLLLRLKFPGGDN